MIKINPKVITIALLIMSFAITGGITIKQTLAPGGVWDDDPGDGGMG